MAKQKYKEYHIGRIVMLIMIPLFIFALVLTGFFTFRRTFSRLMLDFYFPFLSAVNEAANSAAAKALQAQPREKLASALITLQRQNTLLANSTSRTASLASENEHLRALMKMPRMDDFKEVYAEILLRDAVNWNEQFVLSKGSSSGIAIGDPVIAVPPAASGAAPTPILAGRVIEASKNSAVVATVLSPQCQVSVTLAESSLFGTLTGDGASSGTALITRLPVKGKYGNSEMVLTSGFSEHVPRGIFIGSLSSEHGRQAAYVVESGLYAEARMKPAVSLENLRFVVVLTKGK